MVLKPRPSKNNLIIERFHRTLRNIILKYTVANGRRYLDKLDEFMYNYNHTFHKTVHNTPADIWKGKEKNDQEYHIIPHELNVGDQVRHTLEKEIYGKQSSTPTYTQKIFTITKKEGNAYYLDDLTKPFREHELILATGENNNERDEEEENIILKEKEEKNQKKELKNLQIDQPNYKKEGARERRPNFRYV